MLHTHALIGLAALGIALGSGAAAANPIGLQSLPMFQERAATAEPVHYRQRRHAHVKRHFVHPRFHKRHFAKRHFVHPRFHKRHVIVHPHFGKRHHFVRRHHGPSVSFGLRFGHW